jgi:SSS family solute:Na+ symporter
MTTLLAQEGGLRLDVNVGDYAVLIVYFVVVLGIGFAARRSVSSSLDFFLSGRALPAWVTGLAFISANLGAIELLGMAANGAQYGMPTFHYYWIGAIPAMVFLGIVMMPFYYGTKVRSVPEYLRLRFNRPTHLFNALTFALASVLIAGVNLFALALIMQALLGWSLVTAIVVAAFVVLSYTFLGGLTAAVYNEVLQFFVIIAFLIPLTVVALVEVGGWGGMTEAVRNNSRLGEQALNAWQGTSIGEATGPFGNWLAIAFGLGFVLSFGYWTTNFAEVQRALSAKSMNAARLTPIIGAWPKLLVPFVIIVPGLIAASIIPGLGGGGDLQYNNTLQLLVDRLLPNGVLGIAITGLLAAFMAGMAANVSSFNTVVTYDIIQPYIRPGRPDHYYLQMGRYVTVAGVLVAIGTAFIASGYQNIMNYIQLLFSFFNAPLFATFIIALFWKRATPWAGLAGLVAGTLGAAVTHYLNDWEVINLGTPQAAAFWGAGVAFIADAVVTVIVSLVTQPKPDAQLRGLVWSLTPQRLRNPARERGEAGWYRSPMVLGLSVLAAAFVLNIVFG